MDDIRVLLKLRYWLVPGLCSIALILISQIDYLTFHLLAELFAITIAFMIFTINWQTYQYTQNTFLMFLACGYFWVGTMDLAHALSFENMQMFIEGDTNITSSFWIVARYLEATTLVIAPLVSARTLNRRVILTLFGIVSLVLTYSILTGAFPTTYVDGTGLTQFKIYSEYTIVMVLAAALVTLLLQQKVERTKQLLIATGIAFTIMAELAFTNYVGMSDNANLLGHLLKIFSFWFIFHAIIAANLHAPYARLLERERHYKMHYDRSPTAILTEDLTGLLAQLEKLRTTGITDIRTYLHENLDAAWDLSSTIKVLDANEATLKMFGIDSNEEFLERMGTLMGDSHIYHFIDQVDAIWHLESTFQCNMMLRTFDDNELNVIFRLPVPQTMEEAQSVPVSIIDLSDQIQAAEKTEKAHELMSSAAMGVVGAMAATIEKRDPYTAGHQSRVSKLAVEIARELDWDEFRLEGLRLGALIHNIGTIQIPGEILNRPGSLSEAEFGIVQSHSETGADIVSRTEFPWAIQKMIMQHHERIDGSGYPLGLIGDEIVYEAKVIAVADIVEAIISHRPYRPAQTLETAVVAIKEARDITLDLEVVDACLRVVESGNYSFDKKVG